MKKLFFVIAIGACLYFLVRVAAKNKAPVPAPAEVGKAAGTLKNWDNWQQASLVCEGSLCHLQLVVAPMEMCQYGDLDAIRLDLSRYSSKQEALLTLETIDPYGPFFEPITRKIPVDELVKGKGVDFSFPKTAGPLQLGVFLCKDSSALGRCRGKEFMDVMAVEVRDRMMGKRQPHYESGDVIYFFQYVFINGESLRSFAKMDANALVDAVYNKQRDETLAEFPVDQKDAAGKAFEAATSLSRTLRSMPLELSPGRARVVLPFYQKGCSQAAQKPVTLTKPK